MKCLKVMCIWFFEVQCCFIWVIESPYLMEKSIFLNGFFYNTHKEK
jgi:hypothetical protein